MSLPQAVTLFFVSPFFVTISSKFIIGEKIGPYRWSAIFIGFLGVYLVLDPDFSNFNFYSLFPIFCAFFYALTVVIQKKHQIVIPYLHKLFIHIFLQLYFQLLFIL
ncbi:MAG: EamA family transporter [Pelagibacteraceae bacterium]|nr:EamA family transporter [Pelagibacteraceae bacterium]MBT3902113.1 EamA family transporter [Pelagibacteraceae bacterium]MBT4645585.1 EamA family transporter [Pelagibacteraceae bacterium]